MTALSRLCHKLQTAHHKAVGDRDVNMSEAKTGVTSIGEAALTGRETSVAFILAVSLLLCGALARATSDKIGSNPITHPRGMGVRLGAFIPAFSFAWGADRRYSVGVGNRLANPNAARPFDRIHPQLPSPSNRSGAELVRGVDQGYFIQTAGRRFESGPDLERGRVAQSVEQQQAGSLIDFILGVFSGPDKGSGILVGLPGAGRMAPRGVLGHPYGPLGSRT